MIVLSALEVGDGGKRKGGCSMRIPDEATARFGQAQLQMLLGSHDELCISIFLPSQRMGAEIKESPFRLAQLLDKAEKQLMAMGYRLPDAQNILKPARTLPTGARAPFWQHQQEGLAIFLGKDFFVHYWLPIAFAEQVTIGDRFAIRPLLPLLSGDGEFYLLALSEKQVRFFSGTRFSLEEQSLPKAPKSLADTLRFDEFEKQLQEHSATSSGLGRGRGAAVFHGQGDAGDAAIIREQIQRFLHEVDVEVCRVLSESRAPLVLAGVESMQGLYRSTSHYPVIAEGGILGNPDKVDAKQLHQRAWEIVAPSFKPPIDRVFETFGRLHAAEAEHTLPDWEHVIPAAYFQQVETLVVPVEAQIWGTFEPETAIVALHPQAAPGDEDLVDAAAAYTLRNGGKVYAVAESEMPFGVAVVAILRT